MVSIFHERNSTRIVIRRRGQKPISRNVGKLSEKQKTITKANIEALETAVNLGLPVSRQAAQWAMGLPSHSPLVSLLADAGLVTLKRSEAVDVFMDRYIKSRVNLSSGTIRNYRQSERYINETFAGRSMRNIQPTECTRWRDELDARLSHNTVALAVRHAKIFWRAAMLEGLADANPFDHLSSSERKQTDKLVTIPAEHVRRWLAEIDDPSFRCMVALGRWGGLRIPSEARALKWSHVDWERMRLRVPKVKTAPREVPLFPELVQPLRDVGLSGGEYVLSERARRHGNPGVYLKKALRRAGIEPWPALLRNLRSTRSNEIRRQYGEDVESAWIGHDHKVRGAHYTLVSDEEYAKAVKHGV